SRMQPGSMAETGHALDVAIAGQGWFAIQTPEGEAYTRAGEFAINADNLLVTQTGRPVLSADNATIEVPERGTLTFGVDGAINVLGAGENPREIQMIGQLKLVNPPEDQLIRSDDGLFRLPQQEVMPADPEIRVAPGFIEKSNVSVA